MLVCTPDKAEPDTELVRIAVFNYNRINDTYISTSDVIFMRSAHLATDKESHEAWVVVHIYGVPGIAQAGDGAMEKQLQ